eukprot:g7503.t1
MAGAGYPTGTVESVKAPAGCPQLVPDEPPSKDLAAGVADCVVNPLQAQYTWDSLTTLIESCRRLRKNNWQEPNEAKVKDVNGSRPEATKRPSIQELMMAAAQYTEMAASLRQKGELDRAIRTMERAVGMASKAEYHHPAMAVETARARINLAATLSEAKRHRAALMAIKKAQNTLSRAHSILEEARTLRCAGLVAESIQMELCPGPSVEPAGSGYDAHMAPSSLPGQTVSLPPLVPPRAETKAAKADAAATAPVAGRARPRAGPTEQRQAVVKERTDVFSEFLRGREAERVARLGSLNDNWEDQAKRRLGQVFMKAMKKANRCWSDPVLVQEAAKEKATPEICQIRKLNRQLYVKPPTPPPVQPPKPKMDAGLASNLRSNHVRSSLKTDG